MKNILKHPKFHNLEIPIGFMDIHEMIDFKNFKGIKQIPKIYIYKNDTEIEF